MYHNDPLPIVTTLAPIKERDLRVVTSRDVKEKLPPIGTAVRVWDRFGGPDQLKMPRQFHYQAVFDGAVWREADEPFRDVTLGVETWDEITYVELVTCRCGSKQQKLAHHSDGRHLVFISVCCVGCQLPYPAPHSACLSDAFLAWNAFQTREKQDRERRELSKRSMEKLDRQPVGTAVSKLQPSGNLQPSLWD